MKRVSSLLFAVLVFISGVALVPVMGLPSAGFAWQRYANVYVPTALQVSHATGRPGSFFTVTGVSYPASVMVTVFVNGVNLGEVQTDQDGNLLFVIDSSVAAPGYYTVSVNPVLGVFTRFLLDPNAPLWPQEVNAPVLLLPANIANEVIFMPSIHR